MSIKKTTRSKIISAMRRKSNPNKSADSMARILGAVAGVSSRRLEAFINGDDDAITEAEAKMVDSLS